ncbi:hypothetical protein RHGRI_023084 [Rhododendron griersonianum]|uniref:Uncharacterized protein n=1 Tax=Rhododendron griersonianum TaxID=479676 RepID=A0AAV6J3H0_9ERIC|nr:hypothetical protein RHGRI_023084 [Rhododendron griersonianum]
MSEHPNNLKRTEKLVAAPLGPALSSDFQSKNFMLSGPERLNKAEYLWTEREHCIFFQLYWLWNGMTINSVNFINLLGYSTGLMNCDSTNML